MDKKKKILFIQHASGFGGSAMSLLYTLQGIKTFAGDKYEVVVALAKWTKQLSEFYQHEGFEVVKPERIETYEHTQGVYYNLLNPFDLFKELKQKSKIKNATLHTEKLLEIVKPDIVHLNSVVLVGSAIAVKKKNIPLVWHVREPSIKGLFGIRRLFIKKMLRTLASRVIFICKADQASWGNPQNGSVVYNFIDFQKFNLNLERPLEINGTKIPQGDLNILFLGAVGRIKGGLILVKAINELMKKYPEKRFYMLFPGGIYNPPTYILYKVASAILPLIGFGTYSQNINKEIDNSLHPENFIKFTYVKEVAKLMAAADVLVFPSIRPHFARPIIEAGAMGKPSIGSKLGGVIELIDDTKTGFLVEPNSVSDLVEKLTFLLENEEEIQRIGMNSYKIALEKFQNRPNITQIVKVYEVLFK
jgi:glycosyltransferase involved in cell wall biosynthesis